jgi:hypothetical protein
VGKRVGKRPLGTLRRRWGIFLKWIFKKSLVGVDRIVLAQNRGRWQAFMNAAVNRWIA